MMSSKNLTFGLRNGAIAHIDDVENGIGCMCTCPGCGERLVAKQGAKAIHHFAHEGGSDCKGGLQTALHLAAKEVLVRERRMMLPKLDATASVVDMYGGKVFGFATMPERLVHFDDVFEETKFEDMIPDIMGKIGDRKLMIEVAVSHFIDDVKLCKIKYADIGCIEIDLSKDAGNWDWPRLTQIVVAETNFKKWIHNPRHAALVAEAEVDAARKAQQQRERYDRKLRELEFETSKIRDRIPGYRIAEAKLNAFMEPLAVQARHQYLEQNGPREKAWLWAAQILGVHWDHMPPFIGMQVPGGAAFKVHPKVWQAAFFANFIVESEGAKFRLDDCIKWCKENFPREQEHYVLLKNQRLLSPKQKGEIPCMAKAVQEYLRVLHSYNVIQSYGVFWKAR